MVNRIRRRGPLEIICQNTFHINIHIYEHMIYVDPQFCPSTLTFYPIDVTLTHRSHAAPNQPVHWVLFARTTVLVLSLFVLNLSHSKLELHSVCFFGFLTL